MKKNITNINFTINIENSKYQKALRIRNGGKFRISCEISKITRKRKENSRYHSSETFVYDIVYKLHSFLRMPFK